MINKIRIPRRINVGSGRAIESKANFSRAIKVNELVLQSGTTAIDVNGSILGETVSSQVDAILAIAEQSMAAANGQIYDSFRARLYVKGQDNIPAAKDTFRRFFGKQCPATTTFEISALTRPQQLVEIELEGLSEPISNRLQPEYAETDSISDTVKIGPKIFVPGFQAEGITLREKLSNVRAHLQKRLILFGASTSDIVSIKFYSSNVKDFCKESLVITELCALKEPVVSFVGVPTANTLVVEAEARVDEPHHRKNTSHPLFDSFSETVCIGEDIYVSNIYPVSSEGDIVFPNDWGKQRNACTEYLKRILSKVNATLDDVIVRRYLTLASVSNTDYENGPAWFESTKPAALGCRISDHAISGACISLDTHAIRGAGDGIVERTIRG